MRRPAPVKTTQLEAMPAEEFDRLRRARARGAADPGMAELLDRLETGETVRVPLRSDQTARGLPT